MLATLPCRILLSLIVELGTTSILRGIITLPIRRNCSTIGILSCVAKLNAHLPPSRTDSASYGRKKIHDFETQVDIVLACCVLHNYILGVDPKDELVVDELYLGEKEVKEDNLFEYEQYSQTSTQDQRNVKKAWEDMRDQIAQHMWHDYCIGHACHTTLF
ncbi:uncharacterized protein M6B38_347220 [Iris pallida]|uniref:DDE Tnp4 domain-containing protein n=1 Tax=Iris pallida TaxID=29817 RepID=A0AAX6GT47_IRIPA|nr:uncharacterized protein M6B38_347220 [Iris pallida]